MILKKTLYIQGKKNRPIPSGKITRNQAIILITTLLVISEIFAILLNVQFFILNSMLIASMITYSIKIKNIFLMDVFSIAINYVFRAMSGAYLIDVKISPWLIMPQVIITRVVSPRYSQ